MKIVKRCPPPDSRVWSASCLNCKTEVEALGHELTVEHSQRDGPFARSKCPVCGQTMIFLQTSRFEPATPRRCAKCGKPEDKHDVRHPFVAWEPLTGER